ncbi:hypothetical protein PR202_ga24344 [Eleusine coracana subsp. coracana]|uniref:Uncharacterized protein n=1 Tax=Eleusine coracana subsp. coracana TaxID=191504 RepID=A0AAV5D6I9_ELECO|nr:hypothetical protein PR202_ga24344 [Eleusine coracana subsp. coracana]
MVAKCLKKKEAGAAAGRSGCGKGNGKCKGKGKGNKGRGKAKGQLREKTIADAFKALEKFFASDADGSVHSFPFSLVAVLALRCHDWGPFVLRANIIAVYSLTADPLMLVMPVTQSPTPRDSSAKVANFRWRDSAFCRPAMRKTDIAKELKYLLVYVMQIVENKSKLPISSFKQVIYSTLENHQVVLISGETGCGKTTQVPQYILDHMWGKGESCKIICSQPRRISAISVAERISTERGESVGRTVGYKVSTDC